MATEVAHVRLPGRFIFRFLQFNKRKGAPQYFFSAVRFVPVAFMNHSTPFPHRATDRFEPIHPLAPRQSNSQAKASSSSSSSAKLHPAREVTKGTTGAFVPTAFLAIANAITGRLRLVDRWLSRIRRACVLCFSRIRHACVELTCSVAYDRGVVGVDSCL